MPVSSVRVTEGSGPYLHTWQRSISSVNREDQYVQLGEPALPTFSAFAVAASTTTAAHVLQVMAGSSTYVRIHRIFAYPNDWPAAASLIELAVFRLSTAGSGGASVSCSPLDPADTTNATAQSLPSSKGTEGSLLFYLPVPMGTAASASDHVIEWQPAPRGKPIIIPAGTSNGIAIKVITGVASTAIGVGIEFTETAWL